ncbi:LytR family transcriptional regulator [Thermopolyspora flexuosa]|uniref:LytR family transcriptional attenuator n=1 Tax=Thermopolyspora flexuosa TaxID=103836 RepID=A0A543J221_9ACTN|nr:LCP family protein [Thermopolyspora flexuosa]TQM76877.1 LytR family transcriptional attenuator [Thermopolyspora flexuosa]GGM87408.1 LytR family transcriptional regulator [Thermopolyspora flexuosa]
MRDDDPGARAAGSGDEAEVGSGVRVGGDAYGKVRLDPPRASRTGGRSGPRPAPPGCLRRAVRRKRRDPRARRRSLIVTGALSALVLAGSGVVWALPNYAAGQVGAVDAGTVEAEPRGALNILLVGVDRRDHLTRRQQNLLHLGRDLGRRTDTMMLIHLSEDHDRITVVSLPRDSWVTIPGKGEHKINSAYQFGGPKLTVETVRQATGLPIHHYVEVNVLGFIDVVDAVGGIEVCTPVPINDTKTKFRLPAGTHELDGVQALFYARTRATARSDLDRIDRQQQVLSALLDRALSGGTLANPVRLTNLINSALRTITVDRALSQNLLGLAEQLRDVSTDDVEFATVPLADVDYRTPTGESAVLWDKAAAAELFRRIKDDEPLIKPVTSPSATPSSGGTATPGGAASATPSPSASPTIPPSRIMLRVYNGTDVNGLGARTRQELIDAGFLVPSPAGNTATAYEKTVIRYAPGREDSARTVAAAIPGAEVRQADIEGIEVIVGRQHPGVRKVTVAVPSPAATPGASPSPSARTATQNICRS